MMEAASLLEAIGVEFQRVFPEEGLQEVSLLLFAAISFYFSITDLTVFSDLTDATEDMRREPAQRHLPKWKALLAFIGAALLLHNYSQNPEETGAILTISFMILMIRKLKSGDLFARR